MKLSEILSESRPFACACGPLRIEGRFRPAAYTPRLEQTILGLDRAAAPAAALAETLSSLLERWDLEDASGAPIPLDAERLADVPVQVLAATLRAVAEAMAPNATGGASSAAI